MLPLKLFVQSNGEHCKYGIYPKNIYKLCAVYSEETFSNISDFG